MEQKPALYEYRTTPYEHQKNALRRGWQRRAFAYLMEMGTGKTKVAIDELSCLFERGDITRVLIIAPKGVYLNWSRRELLTHTPERVLQRATIVEWHAGWGGADNKRKIEQMISATEGLQILVMNVEALSAMAGDALKVARAHCRAGSTICIVDESPRIKNPSATRTKNVVSLGRLCDFRRILTGSAITNSPLDVYSQFEFLQEGILGHGSFFSFRARYAIVKKLPAAAGRRAGAGVVVGHRNLEQLRDKIAEHSFRVTKSQCLDLPPKIYQHVDVEMTDEQRKAYTEMRTMFTTELDSSAVVTATMAITQITRLQQILCGYIVDDDGVHHDIPSNRLSSLMSVLEETEGKVIIWTRFVHTIREICAALRKEYGGESVAEFWGQVSTSEREEHTRRFMDDPTCRFMVSNQQTGAFGNTWTSASTVVYFSNSHDLELREQSEDRCHRIGQHKAVNYVDLIVPDTIDTKILDCLRKKIDISTIINGDEYRQWLR